MPVSEIREKNYSVEISNYLDIDDVLTDLTKDSKIDIEKRIASKVLGQFAHLQNTSIGTLNSILDPLLDYVEKNISRTALLFPNTEYEHLKKTLVHDQINSIRDHKFVHNNSILTMKKLYELDENNLNTELINIRDEIKLIHNKNKNNFLFNDDVNGLKEQKLLVEIDKALLEQALLTQIENSLRVNKNKDDLTFNFDYSIRAGFMEIKYTNNGKPASKKIASTMFTENYHSGFGEGGGFGQKLIKSIFGMHAIGNLKGKVRMNKDAEKIFGFTMFIPLPINQG